MQFFKKKCPVCKMILGEKYVEAEGQKFCSEACRDEYKKQLTGGKSDSSKHGCCC